MPELIAPDLELTEQQEAGLQDYVERQLLAALEDHRVHEERIAKLHRAYKAKPEVERKSFPWPGASNVVIPIVGITVDAIVARLMRSFLGVKDPIECEIKDPSVENLEKDFRDWASMFLMKSGARDRLRTTFHDMTLDGTSFVKLAWASVTRVVHSYNAGGGGITATEIIDYEGPVWDVVPRKDLIYPRGFDEWSRLPWVAHRLRFTWDELVKARDKGQYVNIDDQLKSGTSNPVTDSPVNRLNREAQRMPHDTPALDIYTFYELQGRFEIPPADDVEGSEPEFADLILTYCIEDKRFHAKKRNPFFGHARTLFRIPFLHQPHEIEGLGAAEQVEQFQQEASTAHNQTIDSATAAIAGIVVRKDSAEPLVGKEIHPGVEIVTDDPKNDFAVVHLSMGNSTLPGVEQQAAFWAEKRSGVSAYNMGVESPVAGSRATATGTTALISEGNQRFWVSIDDMRDALVDLLYATLQLEQQMRPDGIPLTATRNFVLPQGDLRSLFGLRLMVSSEKVNRDLEIQNFQILITILNDYYARLMQAGALIMNPMFPPGQKMLIISVMEAAHALMRRMIERFDIENIDEVLPGLMNALQMIGGQLGPAAMATPPPRPGIAPGGPGGGPQQPPGGVPQQQGQQPTPASAG